MVSSEIRFFSNKKKTCICSNKMAGLAKKTSLSSVEHDECETEEKVTNIRKNRTENVDEETVNANVYEPKDSAYVQHLAEICHIITNDDRYRGLFKWEYGDNLVAVHYLREFYSLKACSNNKLDDKVAPSNESMVDDRHGRAMLLYCRLFHRQVGFQSRNIVFLFKMLY